jgi:hypothetical protein
MRLGAAERGRPAAAMAQPDGAGVGNVEGDSSSSLSSVDDEVDFSHCKTLILSSAVFFLPPLARVVDFQIWCVGALPITSCHPTRDRPSRLVEPSNTRSKTIGPIMTEAEQVKGRRNIAAGIASALSHPAFSAITTGK